jgi:predicted ester cyclase
MLDVAPAAVAADSMNPDHEVAQGVIPLVSRSVHDIALQCSVPFGLDGRGRRLEFRLLHVIEFAANGDIRRENVWIDLAAILRQLPQT